MSLPLRAAFYIDIHCIHNLLSKVMDAILLVVMFIVHIFNVGAQFMIQRFKMSHSYSPSSFKCLILGVVGVPSAERCEPMLSRMSTLKVSIFRGSCTFGLLQHESSFFILSSLNFISSKNPTGFGSETCFFRISSVRAKKSPSWFFSSFESLYFTSSRLGTSSL